MERSALGASHYSGTFKEIGIAVPEIRINATPPTPLFTTKDNFASATLKLLADKALGGTEDEN